MLSRTAVLMLCLCVLLVDGDRDSHDVGLHATSTDKDSTSDEAHTESMNVMSADQPEDAAQHGGGGGPSDISSSSSETADGPEANQVTAPDDRSSEERGKKKFGSRSAKSHPPHNHQSPAHLPISPVRVIQSPTPPPQPVAPQPKALARNRASRRRSRTNRQQI